MNSQGKTVCFLVVGEIHGTEHACADLKRIFSSPQPNLSHAYLFLGPGQRRKEEFVTDLARAALCLGAEDKPCGSCRSCHLFSSGNHPDYRIIRPDGNKIKLEQIREVCHDTAYLPYLANRKIYFFPFLQNLTEVAANAFLKTLEEPPKSVVFLALAPGENDVMPTILSRMQRVYLSLPELETDGDEDGEPTPDPTIIEAFVDWDNLLGLFHLAEYWEKKDRSLIDSHLVALLSFFREKLLQEPANSVFSRIINRIGQAKGYLASNVNTRLLLEDLYLQIYEESAGEFVVKMKSGTE